MVEIKKEDWIMMDLPDVRVKNLTIYGKLSFDDSWTLRFPAPARVWSLISLLNHRGIKMTSDLEEHRATLVLFFLQSAQLSEMIAEGICLPSFEVLGFSCVFGLGPRWQNMIWPKP